MSNYATNSKVDTIYTNLLSLSGYLNTVNNVSQLNFQTISSYFLLKYDAQNTYQTMNHMNGYLTTGNASVIYQTIANMQYYLTI